jgi:outer membrane phospholipase A
MTAGFLLLACVVCSPGRDVVPGLLAPDGPLPAGREAALSLVALNTTDRALPYDGPPVLHGELAGARGETWPVTLRLAENPAADGEVPARGYESFTYVFPVPAAARGRLVLTVRQPALMHAVLEVREVAAAAGEAGAAEVAATATAAGPEAAGQPSAPAAPPAAAGAGAGAAGADEPEAAPFEPAAPLGNLAPRPVAAKLKHSFLNSFSTYDPVYFIHGPNAPAAKFQFSFQYQMLDSNGWLAREWPLLKGLRFAYTQRSLWDLGAESSPFHDTSYMPELFFTASAPAKKTRGPFTWLGWHAGVGHESNGRDGDGSRSLNTVSARAAFALGGLEGWNLLVAPKIWAYIGDMSDNADLDDYRGFGELRAVFGKNDSLRLSVLVRAGQGFRKGAVQVDATYPLDAFFNNFAAYLHVQYWNGHGESLLRYNTRTGTIRAGLAIVR